jgi:flagellar hook-basal body complex protein FliE
MSMSISSGSMVAPITTGIDPLSIGSMGGSNDNGGFGDVLKNAISQVSTLQGGAEQQVNSLMQGGNADMSKVMISVEKADVAFQLMMQVRNKIVSAYQDIEKMQF